MKNSSSYIYLVICLFIGVSCQSRIGDGDLSISDDLSFILLTEGDSMFLVTTEKDRLVKEKKTKKDASASIYLSEDQKLLFSMNRTDGQINVMDISRFDSWLPKPLERPQPTHYTGKDNHSLIFNDGDGSVIYVKNIPSTTEGFTVGFYQVPGSVAHHGAALYLNGDAIAMTIKNEDEEGVLPKKIALVEISSQEVMMTSENLSLGGIHGAHSNGIFALFGNTEGILWVKEDRSYGLIPNPQPLENSSGNWIGTIEGAGNTFVGSSRNHGLFKIDPEKQSIEILYSSDQIADFLVSPDGKHTLVLTKDNRLILLDNFELRVLAENTVPNQPEIPKGFKIAISNNLLFITPLGYGQVEILELTSLNVKKTLLSDVAISDFKVLTRL
jgi:hypothetical protein